jgi:glycosyltransferase involved in cell wall biosynthesis
VAPAVCIAIPVRNGMNYLSEALDSVLAQRDVDLEVRIRDNLSDDGTVALAQSYADRDSRVTVAVNEEDVAYYGSLNRVLAETEAEWFVPFAHDDLMEPDNVARKLAALREHDAGVAISSVRLIDENGADQGTAPDHTGTPRVVDPPGFFGQIAPNNMVSCQSVVVRTAALRAVAGFDMRAYYAGDWLAWLRLALRERFVTLPEPLIKNRVHSVTGTTTLNRAGINGRDIPATLERVFLDDAMPADWRPMRDKMVAASLTHIGRFLHDDGIRRVEQGWAGYMTVGRAFLRTPDDEGVWALYRALVEQSGLVPPHRPFDAVAPAPEDAEEAAALGGLVAGFAPLLASLGIGVRPDRVDQAMALLEPYFGDTDLDVAVVPTADMSELLVPGRLVLAKWESELVARAEAAGLPVQPYGMPDRFARPPDPARWEVADPSAALP